MEPGGRRDMKRQVHMGPTPEPCAVGLDVDGVTTPLDDEAVDRRLPPVEGDQNVLVLGRDHAQVADREPDLEVGLAFDFETMLDHVSITPVMRRERRRGSDALVDRVFTSQEFTDSPF